MFSWKVILLGILATVTAYYTVDPWMVFFSLNHPVASKGMLEGCTQLANLLHAFVVLTYLAFLGRRLRKGIVGAHMARCLFMANSVGLSWFLVNDLKFVFSRYWPVTWIDNNPSLVQDGAYGFQWFHGGVAFASFPSGHMAVATAFAVGVWLAYPRFRWAAIWFPVLIAFGLIGRQYHFVSDIIAGAVVAYVITTLAWERCARLPS